MIERHVIKLLRKGLRSADPVVRSESVDALAMIRDVRGMRTALASHDAYLRLRALKALAGIPGRGLTVRLLRAQLDPHPDVRAALVDCLARRRVGWLALLTLKRLARDDHPGVRGAASSVLGAAPGRAGPR